MSHMRRIMSSVHMGNYSPVTVHMGSFRSVSEMNKVRPFKFHPGNQAGVSIWENFQPDYQDLCRKNRDLGNRASWPSHINTSKVLQRKKRRGEISETEPARLTRLI